MMFAGHTAAEWLAKAAAARSGADRSFAQSDTDGALSQWADNAMAARYRECAEVAELGGKTWTTLYDLELLLAELDNGQS